MMPRASWRRRAEKPLTGSEEAKQGRPTNQEVRSRTNVMRRREFLASASVLIAAARVRARLWARMTRRYCCRPCEICADKPSYPDKFEQQDAWKHI